MKYRLKRFLGLLLAFMMIMPIVPAPMFVAGAVEIENAEATETGNVAQISDVEYATLAEAIEAAQSEDTIILISDFEQSEMVAVPAGKKITLDLNGKKITSGYQTGSDSKHIYPLDVYGDLTIKDSVGEGSITGRGIYVQNGSKLTVESGSIYGIDSNGGSALYQYDGDIIIKGGLIEQKAEGTHNFAINAAAGTVTVYGGKIAGNHGAIAAVGAAVVIYDGEFVCTGSEGTTDNVLYTDSVGTMVIHGGTFIADNDSPSGGCCVYDANGGITINGGNFSNSSGGDVWGTTGTTINGGTFENLTETSHVTVGSTIVNGGTTYTMTESGMEEVTAVAKIGDTGYDTLQEAINAAAAGSGNVTVEILSDIDLTGVVWSPVTVSDPNYPVVTINGNDKTITGLTDMLFAGTWAGGSGLIINDLTIKDSVIVNDENDSEGTVGVGAFIGFPQASATITLNNCHLVNSTVKGGHWTGGLIGYAAGYAGTDGPVYMNPTIKDCSVTGSTITGKGSTGGVIGHATGNSWTNVVITDTTVSGNTVTSTGSSTNKAGAVVGTIGAAGQETTVNGVTHTGGVSVAAEVSDNEVKSADKTITTIYGRQGTEGGMLYVTGGTYDSYPIEEGVSYAAPQEGYVINEKADGTYGVEEAPAEPEGLSGSGAEEDPYLINDLDDLILFRDSVNAGETKYNASGVYVALGDDIDMSSVDWSVNIGDDCNATFDGIFDGADHTISNLNSTETAQKTDGYICTGLFGAIYGSAVVKNLTIENVAINTGDFTGNNAGAVVGFAYSATGSIENVKVKGNIQINANKVDGVGAIVGYAYGGTLTVKNCEVDGAAVTRSASVVNGQAYVGGIIGYAGGKVELTGNTVQNLAVNASSCVSGGVAGIILDGGVASGNTVKDVTMTSAHANWQNAVGAVAGSFTGSITVSGTVAENNNTDAMVGVLHANKPAEPLGKAQAKIGDTYYGTLEAALAANVEGEVTLLAPIVINAGETVTLDLNGKTVTYNSTTQGEAMITNKGTLTINDSSDPDSGVINYNYTGAADSSYGKGNYTISNGGTLTVNGGKITIANIRAHAKYPIDNNSTTGDAILVINGGHLYNYNTSAIRQFCNSTTYKNSVTINGGLIEGYCAIWVQNPGSKTVNGSLSITGGEIRTTAAAYVNGTSAIKDVASRIYCTIDGDGGAWSTDSAVSITGGTINENVSLAEEAPAAITVDTTSAEFNGYVEVPGLSGSGTEEDPYLINDLDDLKWFRDDVNSGNNYSGETVTLAADIDLAGEEWTPIGDITYNNEYVPADATKVFSGVFDGNDKVISNLNIKKTVGGVDTQANLGLFGITGEGAVIKDLTITNVTIDTDGRNVGALAGFAYKTTLENITVKGDIQIKGGNNVSGVVAMTRHYAMSATNITVSGDDDSTITGNNIVGGIFAEIAPNGSEQTFKSLSIENVAITGVGGVGGIVGLQTGGSVDTVSVKNVVLTGRTDYQGNAMGRIRLGSVAGLMGGKYATIANATVENVTAKNLVGDEVALPIIGANYDASSNATEAKIGDTYYATLADALKANVEGEVTLLVPYVVEAGETVTLDLNGKTVTSNVSTITVDGGTLTVVDSANTGKIITTDATGSYEAIAVKNNGTLTLNGGNVESGCYGIYIYTSGGSVVVNGGSVTIGGTNADGMTVAVGSAAGSLKITGGKFTANGVNYPMYSWGGSVAITGGTFDFKPNVDYIPEGYDAIANSDGTYTVIAIDPPILIGENGYYTLEKAFAAAEENDVITITAAGEYIWPATAIPAGVTVKGTVEGVVATSDGTTVINATTLTVENIDFKAINHAAQVTNGKATALTFTDCSFTGLYAFHVDSANNAELTFNNCVFNGFTTFATTVASIDVNGGKINGAFIARQTTTINDVTFSEDAAVQLGTSDTVSDVDVTITGCTVADTNNDGSTPKIAELINTSNNAENGNSLVVDDVILIGGVAKIGDVRYADIPSAIDAAAAGDTITLLRDIVLEAPITVAADKQFTLELNGKTVSYESAVAGEAMITNKGNLTIVDSSAANTGKISFTYTGQPDTSYGKGNYTISNGGTLTLKSGTVENNTAKMSHACYAIDNNSNNSAATLTIDGGKVVNTNNYAVRQVVGKNANILNINGGEITGTRAVWMQLAGSDTTVAPDVQLNVTGGKLNATGESADYQLAVYSYSYGYSMENVSITISGGEFNGDIALTGGKNKTAVESVNITGGTFNGMYGEVYSYGDDAAAAEAITITGGTFKTNAAEYYAADNGYMFEANADGTYGVAPDPAFGKEALVNGVYYDTVEEALAVLKAGDTLNIVNDATIEQPISIGFDLTINGNGNTLIYTGQNRAIDVPKESNGANVTIKNLTVDCSAGYCERGINYNTSGILTLNTVTVKGGSVTYALNMPSSSNGAMVRVTNSSLTGCIALNVWGQDALVQVTNSALTSVDKSDAENYTAVKLNNNGTTSAEGTVIKINGGSITALDENGQPSIAASNSTATGSINISSTTIVTGEIMNPVAVVKYEGQTQFYGCYTLQEAIDTATDDARATVVLITDIELTEPVSVNGAVTIDLNGKTISGVDETTKSFGLINNKGTLTINDSSAEQTGRIELSATNDNGWSRYSSVISNQVGGVLTVNGGTIEHLGGTSMSYAIDNLTNGKGTSAVTTINGGTVTSAYIGIRQFLNGVEANNTLTVNGGTVTGGNSSIYFQDPSKNANTGTLIIGENANIEKRIYLEVTEGSTEWPVEISIAAAALADGVEIVEDGIPSGYVVEKENGIWGVNEYVASITNADGTKYYETLQAAVDAAQAGETVTLLSDVTLTETLTIAKEQSITMDLNGKTISQVKEQTAAYSMITNKGTLAIKDSVGGGKISYTDTGNGGEYVSNTIGNSGDLTLDGTDKSFTVENLSSATVASNGYPQVIDTNGKLTVNGDVAVNCANYSAVRIWCTTDDDTSVTINGGSFTGSIDLHNVDGNANKGTLEINGGTFNQNAFTAKVIRLVNFGSDIDELEIDVKGGTVNGEFGVSGSVKDVELGTVVDVSGGIFSVKPDDSLAAEGYEFTQNTDGTYGVQEEVEEPVVTNTMAAKAATLLYNDILQIRYKFEITGDNVAEYGMYVFETAEDAASLDVSKAVQNKTLVNHSGTYYGYTDGIAAKNMIDTQYVVGYIKLANGQYVYAKAVEYSPMIYATRMVSKSDTDDATKHLCNALMHYGAAAQKKFGYKTETLMSEGFAAVAYDESVLGESVFSVDTTPTNGFTTKAATLLFEGAITYRIRYAVSSELSGKDLYLEYTFKGTTDSVEIEQINGSYYGYVSGIAAKDMDETVVFKPYYLAEDGSKVYGTELVYNGYEYARRTIASTSMTAEDVALSKAFAMYVDAADKAIAK